MNREELIAYDKWLTRRKWGTGEIISPEKAADIYLAEHPLPPAEGAEKSCLSCRFHNSPTYHDKMWCRDCQQLNHYAQQHPTAEGAEEINAYSILKKLGFKITCHVEDKDVISRAFLQPVIAAMHEFAPLHAQRIADKMVSERDDDVFDKMNCLIGYLERWLNNPQSNNPPTELRSVIDEAIEYLKTREK